MLEFKVENLKVKLGEEVLEFKTRDVEIFKFMNKMQKIILDNNGNEDKAGEEAGKYMLEHGNSFLKKIIVKGDKKTIDLLTFVEITEIIGEIQTGFQS